MTLVHGCCGLIKARHEKLAINFYTEETFVQISSDFWSRRHKVLGARPEHNGDTNTTYTTGAPYIRIYGMQQEGSANVGGRIIHQGE